MSGIFNKCAYLSLTSTASPGSAWDPAQLVHLLMVLATSSDGKPRLISVWFSYPDATT